MVGEVTPQPIPDGSVVITPNQQYNELRALTLAVQDLASKVDPALVGLRKDIDDNSKDIADVRNETRAELEKVRTEVSSLKLWRAGITGALVLLTALLGWGALNLTTLGGG